MYANLVFSPGIDEFYAECARVGVDSVLVADVPVEESAPFRQAALRHNIAPIFICPPNADDDLLRQIASYGRGYTYLLSRAGVTGAENRAALQKQADTLEKLYGQRPLLLTNDCFDISSTEARRLLVFGIAEPYLPQAVLRRIEAQRLYGAGRDYHGLPFDARGACHWRVRNGAADGAAVRSRRGACCQSRDSARCNQSADRSAAAAAGGKIRGPADGF